MISKTGCHDAAAFKSINLVLETIKATTKKSGIEKVQKLEKRGKYALSYATLPLTLLPHDKEEEEGEF